MMSYQYTYSTCTRWMDGTRHNGTCGRRQPKSNKDQEEGLKSYADMTICASQARPACATTLCVLQLLSPSQHSATLTPLFSG